MTHVIYAWNSRGYVVQVLKGDQVIEEYTAGNHLKESQSWVDPQSDNAAIPRIVKRWAEQTAKDYAKKYGDCPVEYDDDLEQHDSLVVQ